MDVTISEIEVHKSGAAEESGWETVIKGQKTFDLIAVTGIEQVLGQNALGAGDYTQIRMNVVKAVVTVKGEAKTATVPSDKLKVVGQFTVEAGKTTILTLDFDADKSLTIPGAGDPIIKPVVKLLVRKGGEPTPTATPTPTPTPVAGEVSVEISGFAFKPPTVNIAVGTKVTWTNKDSTPHTATATAPAGAFDSGNLNQNQSYSRVFDTVGTFDYHCAIHTSMTGKVIVK